MLLCVRWILWGAPLGVFALTYGLALKTGGGAAGTLAAYVAIVCGLTLLFTVMLYPISALLGRTTIRVFARAVAPAQLVAVSTRSSIAALPALVEGGRRHLRLPASITSFVLPLSVSLFKINRTSSSLVKLLFIAHLYGIPLRPAAILTFMVTELVLSFSTVGVPLGGSGIRSLPAYVAAGVPIEGLLILEAVETIPDIFKTVLNVTGDMSAATLLSRSSRAADLPVSAPDASRPAAEGTV
jgi:Na+/H+-dicarboxylate symporter